MIFFGIQDRSSRVYHEKIGDVQIAHRMIRNDRYKLAFLLLAFEIAWGIIACLRIEGKGNAL